MKYYDYNYDELSCVYVKIFLNCLNQINRIYFYVKKKNYTSSI